MRTTHLFASAVRAHFEEGLCELMRDDEDRKDYTQKVLENLVLVGGLCRNILLCTETLDIEIMGAMSKSRYRF